MKSEKKEEVQEQKPAISDFVYMVIVFHTKGKVPLCNEDGTLALFDSTEDVNMHMFKKQYEGVHSFFTIPIHREGLEKLTPKVEEPEAKAQ